jgi:hypothetical protein
MASPFEKLIHSARRRKAALDRPFPQFCEENGEKCWQEHG